MASIQRAAVFSGIVIGILVFLLAMVIFFYQSQSHVNTSRVNITFILIGILGGIVFGLSAAHIVCLL